MGGRQTDEIAPAHVSSSSRSFLIRHHVILEDVEHYSNPIIYKARELEDPGVGWGGDGSHKTTAKISLKCSVR